MEPPLLIEMIKEKKSRKGQKRNHGGSLQPQCPVIEGYSKLLWIGFGEIQKDQWQIKKQDGSPQRQGLRDKGDRPEFIEKTTKPNNG